MSFAQTKIQRPRPRAGLLIARPALETRLVAALSHQRAVLLCAPAGYGKTALLVRALDQLPAGHAVAWISLDAGDDLHRLLECLIAALEPFDPPWRTAPEGLIAAAALTGDRPRQELVDEFVNVLEACDVAHGVIVLDDAHHLDDPACEAFLTLWLPRLGPRWTIVFAARHEPPLRLARLRAAGELLDVAQDDLQFDRDEVRALLAAAGHDDSAAEPLWQRTGGWAAGLRLALQGAQGAQGSSGTIDRPAFDFLATEVLARIDPELRDFLLLTSVLIELDETRCNAITLGGRSAFWLEEIERQGLFVSVVEDHPRTLRLHDLFRGALLHRLQIERPTDWLAQHLRAAKVEDDPMRRQALLLAAQQPVAAARALYADCAHLLTQGAVTTLLHMVEQFPPAFVEHSAELNAVAGTARWSIWDARVAERHFARAQVLFAQHADHDAERLMEAQRAITLIGLGRLGEAGTLLHGLDPQPLEGEARIHARVARTWHALENCSYFAVAGHFESLVQALEERPSLLTWYFTVPPPRQTACRGVAPALARWADGALALCGERPLPLRALALLTQGWHALWQGRLADARPLLERAEADVQWTGRPVISRAQSLQQRALVDLLDGEHATALAAMQARIDEYALGYGQWGLWHTLFSAARVAAACADLARLREWTARLLALEPTLPDATPARLQPIVGLQGTLAALEGRADEAAAAWQAALSHEEQTDLLGQADEVRARLAWAHWRAGRKAAAQAALAPLLERVGDGPRGLLFAVPVLHDLAAAGVAPDNDGARLLERWADLLPRRDAPTRPVAAAALPAAAVPTQDVLTGREWEVLALIANGDSNKLIARALELSPFTVKRHVAHILEKLMVNSRGQAAAWFHAHAGAAPAR